MEWVFGSLVVGLLAGAVAGRVVQGSGFGCLGNIIVGAIGGLVGGWLFSVLDIQGVGTGFVGSLITATVGAIVFLAALNLVTGRKKK
jgi:uncharacterized membrane protein YeaQ/YmgE (transglycosylase-associated protein family)